MKIGYETFKDNKSFLNWQREYPHRKIINIQPLPLSFNGETDSESDQFSGNILLSVFVTFFYNEDKKEIRISDETIL